jgi:transketolase
VAPYSLVGGRLLTVPGGARLRAEFRAATADLPLQEPSLVVLLGDIGVHGFRQELRDFPDRVINFGIMEQTMVGFAAGLAKSGFVPVLHSIAPFLVERALEQIKIDFGYQGLGVNLVSVGASFDYAALGASHHCPGDVLALLSIPGVEILVPGHPDELRAMIRAKYLNGKISYFRLSERSNSRPVDTLSRGWASVKSGFRGLVLAIGPMLEIVMEACQGMDLSVAYLTDVSENAIAEAVAHFQPRKILVVEPFYEGTTSVVMNSAMPGGSEVKFKGVPRAFIHSYGTYDTQLALAGLSSSALQVEFKEFFGC